MEFGNPDLRLRRIREIIEEIYVIAKGRTKWYLDSKVALRMNWLKNLEESDE